jgi:transposase
MQARFYVKKPVVASERLRAHLKERRKNWFRHHLAAMQEHPDRLVFIDETSVKNNLTCQYGRSLCGKRLEMDAPFGAWGTQAFIVGLTHDHLIAPWVIKGAMDGEAFEVYVWRVPTPQLQPEIVVICDDLAAHDNKAAAAALSDVGCWFLYLPPYSPDLNPIDGLLKAKGIPTQNWGKNIRPDVRRPHRNLQPLHTKRMLEPLLWGWISLKLKARCFKSFTQCIFVSTRLWRW